jgi:hypothetical protein
MNRQPAALLLVFLCPLYRICNTASFGQEPPIAEKATSLSVPRVELPRPEKHPMIACTPEELGRLKAAYAGNGREQEAVARVIIAAGGQLGRPVVFPPRGGQHNQWYQCDKCQIGLKTVDATHHQCPRCKTVYSGEPYDDVLFAHVHNRNLRAMSGAAWAYAITGEEKYATLAAQVLVGYASRYKKYPYHDSGAKTGKQASKSGGHLFEQTLNEASEPVKEIEFRDSVWTVDWTRRDQTIGPNRCSFRPNLGLRAGYVVPEPCSPPRKPPLLPVSPRLKPSRLPRRAGSPHASSYEPKHTTTPPP